MFIIHTTNQNHPQHHLLIPSKPGWLNDEQALHIELRICYGDADPYRFKPIVSLGDDVTEIVTHAELQCRIDMAMAYGEEYDIPVYAVAEDGELWQHIQAVIAHFRAMMTMNLFKLPVTPN